MALSKYLLDAHEQYRMELRVRNKWMVRIRWYYLLLLPSVAIASTLLVSLDKKPIRGYIFVALCGLLINGLMWLATMPRKLSESYYQALALSQIMLDLTLASYVVYTQHGLASRATLLYSIPILAGGLLFMRGFSYLAATLSAGAYSATLLTYLALNPEAYMARDTVVPIVFYGCVFFVLAAIIASYSTVNAMDERQKSYTELIAMMRHQLHHPTGVIAAIVEMLEHSESFNKLSIKDQEYVHQLKHENHRLNSMIANLLESVSETKPDEIHADEPVNLTQLVDETAISCAAAAKRPNDLKVNYPVKAFIVAGHPQQLAIAIENILDNAFRYSPPGSEVKVSIEQRDPWVKITISDHGQGISNKERRQLFQRFTKYEEGTEKDATQMYAMGLGLYVSKVIIERHDGKLEVESETGRGTKITISL